MSVELPKREKKFWLAIYQSVTGTYHVAPWLYSDETEASLDLGPGFVRLATEWPPIVLPEIKRVEESKPPQVGKGKIQKGYRK